MRDRSTLNLVLAAVVIALLWLAFGKGDREPPAGGIPVMQVRLDELRHIRIEASGNPAVMLSRDDGVWRVTQPYRAPADPHRVAALLGLATTTSEKGFRAAGNDLSQYGLEPPKARVLFDDRALRLGDTDPVEHLRYVLSDDQVHLVADRWFSHVFGDAAAWIDPRPLGGATGVEAITLPDARWQRTGAGWQRTPALEGTSADAGPRLADAWRHARALSVRPLQAELPWSGTASVTVSGHAQPREFAVAETADALFLGDRRLQVQYRFLRRQGDALLGRNAG